jgi:hypothetical protein
MKNFKNSAFATVLLITSTIVSLPLLPKASAFNAPNFPSEHSLIMSDASTSQRLLLSVAPNWKDKFPKVKDAIKGELEAHLKKFARGNRGDASVEVLEVRGSKLYMQVKIRHKHVWKKPWGGSVTVYSLTNTVETSLDPLNPNATVDKTRLCFDLAQQVGGGKVCVSAGDVVRIMTVLL